VAQTLLFPDPKPLVERLGKGFFRRLPRRPGVYLMRDARENVLYVGKAKDLRQRLNHYRIANPDRLPKRHLRLLRQVVRIEWKLCRDETAALTKEAELLRTMRPQFNRAGVWPAHPQCVAWRFHDGNLTLKITAAAAPDWHILGPVKGARWLRLTLARLLWLATRPAQGIRGLPVGWHAGRIEPEAVMTVAASASALEPLLLALKQGGTQLFVSWVRQQTAGRLSAFEQAWLEAELEALAGFPLDRLAEGGAVRPPQREQQLFAFA